MYDAKAAAAAAANRQIAEPATHYRQIYPVKLAITVARELRGIDGT